MVRFDFTQGGRRIRSWMLLHEGEGEICRFDPGFGDDLAVIIDDPLAFTRWHVGLTGWAAVLRTGGVRLSGPADLRRALPTWNDSPDRSRRRRAGYRRTHEARGGRPEPGLSRVGHR